MNKTSGNLCVLFFSITAFKSSTVESRISGTQNSGKSRISGQFLNDQLIIDRIEWTTKIVENLTLVESFWVTKDSTNTRFYCTANFQKNLSFYFRHFLFFFSHLPNHFCLKTTTHLDITDKVWFVTWIFRWSTGLRLWLDNWKSNWPITALAFYTYPLIGRERLKSVNGHLATSESSIGLSRIFELNAWKFRLLRMKATKFMHINLEVWGAKRTIEGVTHAPQSPKNFTPGF